MSSTVWIAIAGLTVGTAIIKGSGPVVFGGRALPPLVERIIPLLAPALLAALLVVETVGRDGRGFSFDARLGGLAAAAIALWRRAPLYVVVIVAAAVTAGLRLL
jgi:branched-subunit amino acid transport protein